MLQSVADHGLDLKQSLDPVTFQALGAALIEHKVIYLRDQNLTTAQHVTVSRMFGDLEVHPFRPEGEFPEIMVLDNHKDNPVLSPHPHDVMPAKTGIQ
jgi:taurine dioxygenase